MSIAGYLSKNLTVMLLSHLTQRCVSRSASRTTIRPVSLSASHSRSHVKLNARSERSSKCWF